ncbi:MAG: hypothetical protein A3G49_01510 [Candidatus Sungbacteria bacterium RIFCSPLOWO2_12_FULL_41_11]|uniref:Uncharacterized protein n=1 Tax=Candidatus Sungbacteria bacterium RIFCSPLOWO2_12_FULL_41_11 TaxID=1802286 RepID=A0A1G2LQJ5_9BACT|nr:MAG: hypothetical protein UV01_C0011G0021 [Parcubacteria group bacterium GW2011_GWA2_42_14]OHA13900.1 MAG: hypothetical protein A3G49_01510 [Candidatus Sungbacteria bacterium RIFCSPLOWO2_12_FULL_41_11]
MPTITIEIPKKVLENGTGRRLLVVDPKQFEKDLRRQWEEGEDVEDTKRLLSVAQDKKNQKRIPYAKVKKQFNLP